MNLKFDGFVVYQTRKGNNVKLSVRDMDGASKIHKRVERLKNQHDNFRLPCSGDTFQVLVSGKSRLERGDDEKEYVETLPDIVGCHVSGTLRVVPYCFKSTWGDSAGEEIRGATLRCIKMSIG